MIRLIKLYWNDVKARFEISGEELIMIAGLMALSAACVGIAVAKGL